MAVIRNDGWRPQMVKRGEVIKPRNTAEIPDDEWAVIRERPAIAKQLRDGSLVEVKATKNKDAKSASLSEEPEPEPEMVEGEVAADLDAMDRDALKAFAEAQEITDKVDMRLATDKLRAAIKKALA